jgi:hypothetical protein
MEGGLGRAGAATQGSAALDVPDHESRHFPAEPVPDEDLLDGRVLPVCGQRVGGDLPAPHPEPVGEVIQGEGRRLVCELEADGGQCALPVALAGVPDMSIRSRTSSSYVVQNVATFCAALPSR